MRKTQLPLSLRPGEVSWGIRYLLFELIFLGPLLDLTLLFLFPRAGNAHLNFLYFSVNFLAVLVIFRHFLKDTLVHTGKHIPSTLLAAAVGFIAYWVLTYVLNLAISAAAPEFFNVNDASIAQNGEEHFWLTAGGTVVLVPLAEETLHRGLIFGLFHRKSRVLAYLISTVVFAAIHVTGYVGQYAPEILLLCFVQYLPAGLTLAWAYEFSGSLFAPIAIHTAVNTIAILSMR